ncbi:UdgX family uracil-DNA binding protein [Sandaracinus amylolyticus]|uniref:UdgX family uracil-DNA binding protein n=1 Tax=Sandaracinus amylolyticus TaxID=927083 RepID=UPI001F26998E
MPWTAAPFVPAGASLAVLREAVHACRGCPLYARATQGVLGAGPSRARVMLVGEQPGDREDLEGLPFVGPAGRVLDEALEEAGIARDDVFVTNVVKHFKWEPRGKRRIHQKPRAREVEACRPWLEAELARVRPRALVALGATAAQALLGRAFRVTKDRGRVIASPHAPIVLATHHPSVVLRAPDAASRAARRAELVADLRVIATHLGAPSREVREGDRIRAREP